MYAIKEITEYIENNLLSNLWPVFSSIHYGNPDLSGTGNSISQEFYTALQLLYLLYTICQHLAKSGHSLENEIIDLTYLPDPCNNNNS